MRRWSASAASASNATAARALRWAFAPSNAPSALWPRFIWLRLLGLMFLSAFVSLHFQIDALIGPTGLLPAQELLDSLRDEKLRYFYVPTLYWFGASSSALHLGVWAGLGCALLLTFNVWPRAMCLCCTALFLAFVAAARDFSGYQSDGMLLEAGLLSAFLAPPGLRPGLAASHRPPRIALFLLRWEWFRIYFCSGLVKLLSGDPQWHTLTALEHYYENGPLPTWLGWYAQELPPAWFHHACAAAVLVIELAMPWVMFLSARLRRLAFSLLTPFQIAIILTANYAFLNYIVLALGVLLLDDKRPAPPAVPRRIAVLPAVLSSWLLLASIPQIQVFHSLSGSFAVQALAPFRVINAYGLFAVMTEDRYELEFQGSLDGKEWRAYPFRFKPQDISKAPGIYAPYQPRFEWNLWFAALGSWRQYPWVLRVEEQLSKSDPAVLSLFANDPFEGKRPRLVRVLKWQYWFTTPEEKRTTGNWWKRQLVGEYAPGLQSQ